MEVTRVVPATIRRTRPAAIRRGRGRAVKPFDLAPPAWVGRLFEGARPAEAAVAGRDACDVRVTDSPAFTLVTARVARAGDLDPASFERCARDAYRRVAEAIRMRPHRHAV